MINKNSGMSNLWQSANANNSFNVRNAKRNLEKYSVIGDFGSAVSAKKGDSLNSAFRALSEFTQCGGNGEVLT